MVRIDRLLTPALVAGAVAFPGQALAGATIEFNDTSSIDLGFRLQPQYRYTDDDAAPLVGGDQNDFDIRRARIRLKGTVNEYASIFLQTDAGGAGLGRDVRLIDGFATIKPFAQNWFQIVAGLHMAPVLRQNLTSSGAMMALDRPGLAYKSLNWTLENRAQFTNVAFDSPQIETGDGVVRDLGVTLFGSGSFTPVTHGKYYISTTDGSAAARADDEFRYTVRGQLNFGDPEPGYFNLSTYLGGKQTYGIGASYDAQDGIGEVGGEDVDYDLYTIDLFADQPLGLGSLTAEAAYINLSLDGGGNAFFDGAGTTNNLAAATVNQVEGDGFYVQAGYYINNWQPWAEFETWNAVDDAGSYDAFRVGISYFLKGHNANVKLGFEHTNPDGDFIGTNLDADDPATPAAAADIDDINSVILGFYVTY